IVRGRHARGRAGRARVPGHRHRRRRRRARGRPVVRRSTADLRGAVRRLGPVRRDQHAVARKPRFGDRAHGVLPQPAPPAVFRRCGRRHPARRAGRWGSDRRDRAGGDAGTLARTMEVRPEILALVLGCALVTAVPRVLPLVALSRLQLPPWLADWLRYVPIAVLAALLAIELPSAGAAGLPAIMVAFAVAAATRSLLGTVIAGVALYWLLNW